MYNNRFVPNMDKEVQAHKIESALKRFELKTKWHPCCVNVVFFHTFKYYNSLLESNNKVWQGFFLHYSLHCITYQKKFFMAESL